MYINNNTNNLCKIYMTKDLSLTCQTNGASPKLERLHLDRWVIM